ncbi:uncharacterized protein K452DRAFT_304930 [Aplosporella prunicola CBS 121167]|uniref:TFIIS N-terminal domain-containing protein n=1 Tax=Aplosporella prunicola CBS 121167 TaxID=1176127 RepID=A0A6A6BP55_9PEZI|nr:uncharacterized protein K452DRAFT_304930 [Aplosporella prunicola CBS 121167]KAF2145919.1 hypothetical protein K452DRAFT_304930 [Aplosporella prunicola CBS 121167]
MEDVQVSDTPPDPSLLPEAGNDPADPLRPEIEEENQVPNPPLAAPNQDMELTDGAENGIGEDEENKGQDGGDESELSDVDEAQFEEFDPDAVHIPVAVDESNVGLIGVHKRKRADGEGEGGRKKKKEGRREKPRKGRKRREDEVSGGDAEAGGDERRSSRRKKPEKVVVEEDESNLTPMERRKRALDRAMDEALKAGKRTRRKKDGIDLDAMADAEIEEMRRRMTEAAQADNEGRERGMPASNKLKILPEVVALLNRNSIQNSLVDPDINLLQAVRFFLEPLNDGSLPAYNIQRELFTALTKLPITKDSLIASGIGKVVNFYTKSNRPEPGIKRTAEKLMGDWTRPILKRTDDYRKMERPEAHYDPSRIPARAVAQPSAASTQAAARAKALAPPDRGRARHEGELRSYTIAPKSNIVVPDVQQTRGAGSSETAKRLKLGRAGGGRR